MVLEGKISRRNWGKDHSTRSNRKSKNSIWQRIF